MIEITYERKHFTVEVRGHSNSGTYGHDLVCSGVSTLVHTLAGNAELMSRDIRKFGKPKINVKNGFAEIRMKPGIRMKNVTMMMMDSICTGFSILSQQYPDMITYKTIE